MCELVKSLSDIAEDIIHKKHEDIMLNEEDSIEFVNSVATLQEHSKYIISKLTKQNKLVA